MSIVGLLLAVLACWRITHLLQAEDGPWRAIARFRAWAAERGLGEALSCFLCLSVFVALPPALWLGEDWGQRLIAWPALSAGAILIERAAFPETFVAPADFQEDEES
jgi:hypothetical protein